MRRVPHSSLTSSVPDLFRGRRRAYTRRVRNVLILGGTAEARALAEMLVGEGVDVTSSLAGLKSVLAARPLEQVEPHAPRA